MRRVPSMFLVAGPVRAECARARSKGSLVMTIMDIFAMR